MRKRFLDRRMLGALLVAGAIAAACSATHPSEEPTVSPDAIAGGSGVGGAQTLGNAGQSGGGRTTADASDDGRASGASSAEAGAGGAGIAGGGDDGEGGADSTRDAGLGVSDARDSDAEPDASEPGAGGAPSGTSGTGGALADAGLPPIDCSAPLPEPPSDAGSATRHDVQAILDARCVYCHSTATAPMSLVLTDVAAVVSTHAQECATKLRIQPGNAQASYLVDKISGHSQSPCGCFMGQQMPLDDDPLDDQDIAVIRSWINAGAP